FASDGSNTGSGWMIDDVSITTGPPQFHNPEGFELGVGDWSADNGLWQIGPSDNCFSGTQCAGAPLTGSYANGANTRLISPPITLNASQGQIPLLVFRHWFSIENGFDYGVVQIAVDGSQWTNISNTYTGSSVTWTQPPPIDLSQYT